jgi:hypothetical protein
LTPDAHGFVWMPEGGFQEAVAHKASADQTSIMHAVQRPLTVQCIQEPAPLQIKLAPRRRCTMNASEAQTGQKRIGDLTDLRSFSMLEGVGHWLQLKAPDATNAALSHFYRAPEL